MALRWCPSVGVCGSLWSSLLVPPALLIRARVCVVECTVVSGAGGVRLNPLPTHSQWP